MCSRSSLFSMANSAMTDFIRRPCLSTKSSYRILGPSAPTARKASRHSHRVATVTPCFRLIYSRSAPRSGSRSTPFSHLAKQAVFAVAAAFPARIRSPEGDRRGAGIRGFHVGHTDSPCCKSVSNQIAGRGVKRRSPSLFQPRPPGLLTPLPPRTHSHAQRRSAATTLR